MKVRRAALAPAVVIALVALSIGAIPPGERNEAGAAEPRDLAQRGAEVPWSIRQFGSTVAAPSPLATAPDGAAVFVNRGNDTVGRIDPAGSRTATAIDGVRWMTDLAVAADGTVWVAGYDSSTLGRVGPDGTTEMLSLPVDIRPRQVVAAPDGSVWVTDLQDTVVRYGAVGDPTVISQALGERAVAGTDGALWSHATAWAPETGCTLELTRVAPSGEQSTVPVAVQTLGLGSGIGTCLEGMTADLDGRFWFVSEDRQHIVVVAMDGTAAALDGERLGLARSHDVGRFVVDPAGIVWGATSVTSPATTSIVQLTGEGGVVVELPESAEHVDRGVDGRFWYAGYLSGGVGWVDAQGNAGLHRPEHHQPREIVRGPDRRMWVAAEAAVVAISADGTTERFALGENHHVTSLARGPDDRIWFVAVAVGEAHGQLYVGRLSTSGVLATFPVGPGYSPGHITNGPDGSLWFTVPNVNRIGRITPSGSITYVEHPQMNGPEHLIVGPDGRLWFLNDDRSLGMVSVDGSFEFRSLDVGARPSRLAAAPDGSVWMTIGAPHVVWNPAGDVVRINPDFSTTSFVFGAVFEPRGLVAGPDGAMWITSAHNRSALVRVDRGGNVQFVEGPAVRFPTSIAVGPDRELWFTNTSDSSVGMLELDEAFRTSCRAGGGGPFRDIAEGHQFCGDIEWFASEAITTGYADGTFRPVRMVERQAMAAFLWRAAGRPEVGEVAPVFIDVDPANPFFDAIQWMGTAGVAQGTLLADGQRAYEPTEPVSRQAVAVFLHRFVGEPEVAAGDPTFGDVGTAHPFFEAIEWMGFESISTGTAQPSGEPLYMPAEPMSRQAMAAFLHRYHVALWG